MKNGNVLHCRKAYSILGDDFIPPEEISRIYGLSYSVEQLETLVYTIPTESELVWLHTKGYILVAGPPIPMSLLDIRTISPQHVRVGSRDWHASEGKFCQGFSRNDRVLTTWLGLRKHPAIRSINRIWDAENPIISEVERVPNVAEVAWGLVSFQKVHRVYLLKRINVRTNSTSKGGFPVCIGHFGPEGMVVRCYWDNYPRIDLGLASVRKFDIS